MTDIPDVIDTLFPDVRERPLMDLDGTTTHEPTRWLYTAESIRKILTAAGYVVVKADGLQHGDELRADTQFRWRRTKEPPQGWRLLRSELDEGEGVLFELWAGPTFPPSLSDATWIRCEPHSEIVGWRRSVPENGERPHTHTRGIDRGDCPECDAEYGDTEQVELGF